MRESSPRGHRSVIQTRDASPAAFSGSPIIMFLKQALFRSREPGSRAPPAVAFGARRLRSGVGTAVRDTGSWQRGALCPPLDELSMCVALSRAVTSPKWTAFVYKQRGGTAVELGLAGGAGELHAWLFGEEWRTPVDLPLTHWHTVCLTWSGPVPGPEALR
ncbi:hypothetical protein SKAU_G00227330 [Synaphobranchus kaupii]|uniref:Uncharacterized protein n=1 Tax=Synaphobranchus kaupii TaxID=118154 RepID=A0A9Q1F4W6_SYNKA|nr:hypothetical protein SKAU_G00227330 [Synaphobranchus kaupii]